MEGGECRLAARVWVWSAWGDTGGFAPPAVPARSMMRTNQGAATQGGRTRPAPPRISKPRRRAGEEGGGRKCSVGFEVVPVLRTRRVERGCGDA